MINAIVQFAVKQRVAVIIFAVFLLGTGVWRATQLNIDNEPDVTDTQVVVSALAPAYGPEELETRVTFPLEIALAGMKDLDHTESISQFGLSQVTCYFDEKIDIYQARELVNERLMQAQSQLPIGVNAQMNPVSTGLGEIVHVRLIGGPMTPLEQRTFLDWTARPQLLTVPGIADVNVIGGRTRQWQVSVDAQKLAAHGLAVSDVDTALSSNNANIGGSFLTQGPTQSIVRGVGLVQSLDDVRQIVVSSRGGTPVLLSQVADVQEGAAPIQGTATQDGQGETTVILPLLRIGADTRTTMTAVKAKFATLAKDLPPGAHFEYEFDRTTLIRETLRTVVHNLVEGGVLVIVILFLFLLQLRAGLIVSAIIPLSMMVALIGMSVFGVSANLMSLGAIDFGMVVDGAVIIVENSVRNLAQKAKDGKDGGGDLSDEDRHEIIRKSAVEVLTPSVFGIIIILATYTPVLTLSGIEGKLFKPMAVTVMFALFGSLLLSLTLIPALCAFFLKGGQQKPNKPLLWLTDCYAKGVKRAVEHRWVTVGGALAFLAVSVFFGLHLGSQFAPQLQENAIDISAYYDPSTSVPEMVDRSTLLEKVLMRKFPHEISHILTRIGRPQIPTDPMLQSQCDVLIALRPDTAWTQAKDQKELTAKITKVVNEVPGFESSYSQPIQTRMDEMIYGQGDRADVGIKILGTDMGTLRQQAASIVQVLQGIKGAADVKAETTNGLPQLVVAVNRSALARYGISIADVNAVIDSAIGPRTVTTVNDGNVQIDVTVRLAEAYRSDPTRIGRVLVPGPNGLQVPLSEVASIHNVDGPVQISRENEKRRITITANVRGNDLGSFVQEAQQKIQSQVHLPPGYTLEYAGDYESLKSGRARLLTVIPIALAAILGLLLIVFGRMRQALMIFTGIPLAISGGILALSLRHMPFSMTAAVGFIALGGIALLNGIVLLTFINHLREQGKSVGDATLEGAKERLRPVLMTGTVAAIGFIPMAVSKGMGAEVQQPLATVVIGGLITSTILTLFVLPTLYAWFEKDDDKKEDDKKEGGGVSGKEGPGRNGNGTNGNGNGTNGNGNGTNGNGFHRSPPEDHQPVPAPEGILVPAGERS